MKGLIFKPPGALNLFHIENDSISQQPSRGGFKARGGLLSPGALVTLRTEKSNNPSYQQGGLDLEGGLAWAWSLLQQWVSALAAYLDPLEKFHKITEVKVSP